MKIKKTKGRIAFEIINYTALTLLALICILPFIHLLAMSFSSDEFTSKGVVFLLPKGFTLQAYQYLLQKNEFFTSLVISVMRDIRHVGFAHRSGAYGISAVENGRKIQRKNRIYVVFSCYYVFERRIVCYVFPV